VGALVFVVSAASLGLMAELPNGLLELFGVLAFASDLPQRYAGRLRSPGIPARTIGGVAAGAATGCILGAALAPFTEMIPPTEGAVLGLVVALAVAMGARIADAVAEDLDMSPSAPIVGRRAFLDRTIPALFAAPFYFMVLWFWR
jgi:predicted CDP-diglyceride synthetase/phosphatidate cytidylyltransferase